MSAAIDEVDRSVEQFKGIIRVAELSALLLTLLIAFNAISINLEETFPDLGVVRSIASESLLIAVFVDIVVMGTAPLLLLRRLRHMDIPSTLRVVE